MRAYGPGVAFTYSFSSILLRTPASIAILMAVCAEYTCALLGAPGVTAKPIAAVILVAVTVLNVVSTTASSRFQTIATALKLAGLVWIIAGTTLLRVTPA